MTVTLQDIEESNRLIATYLARWKRYSLSFYIEALQADKFWYPTRQQYELCQLTDRYPHIAIRAGRGVGKTNFLAFRVLHHLVCNRVPGLPVKVPITGPTGGQLSDVIWAEISAMKEHLLPWLSERFVMTNEGLYCKELPKNWFATPRTARKEAPTSLQGSHGSTLNVFDEASGIPIPIMRVATAGMTEIHARSIIAGNPDELSGYFFNVFNKYTRRWKTYGIDCYDCRADTIYSYPYIDPSGTRRIIKVPGRVTEQWFLDQADELGKDSPFWEAYVRGRFPRSATQTLVNKAWVDKAWRTFPSEEKNRPRILGVDPGFERTPSGLVIRQGVNIEHAERLYNQEPMVLAKSVEDLFDAKKAAGTPITTIAVDSIGIGAGTLSILKADGYPAVSVKSSEASPDYGTPCVRLRDWLWWQCRSFFRDYAVHFANTSEDMKILAEEVTTVQQKKYRNGKLNVEDKYDMLNRGFASPNLADALNLTFKVDYVYDMRDHNKNRKKDAYAEDDFESEGYQNWKVV